MNTAPITLRDREKEYQRKKETEISLMGLHLHLLLLLLPFFFSAAKAEVYTVGDEDQWTTSINYVRWSQNHNFTLGDDLVFKYVKGQHNVYEVTGATFRSCDSSSGVLKMYDSGNDVITLAEVRMYWFICGIPGHCLGGMKFGVEVMNEGEGSTTNNMTPPPANTINTANSLRRDWAWFCFFVCALIVTLISSIY